MIREPAPFIRSSLFNREIRDPLRAVNVIAFPAGRNYTSNHSSRRERETMWKRASEYIFPIDRVRIIFAPARTENSRAFSQLHSEFQCPRVPSFRWRKDEKTGNSRTLKFNAQLGKCPRVFGFRWRKDGETRKLADIEIECTIGKMPASFQLLIKSSLKFHTQLGERGRGYVVRTAASCTKNFERRK